ncbi:hypothetical protein FKW77_008430 [Venturia effusa]|uniref:Uncharacterized protein n=1 Tax=Venturia effusa TaxID=50376 RepID=A0A517LHQ9_9PEZI|nr:hypothetical protein FKW77_008430 [Venturia effusa]
MLTARPTPHLNSFLLIPSRLPGANLICPESINLEPFYKSMNQQTSYEELIHSHRDLEKQNSALRCKNQVMQELNRDLSKFHIEPTENLIQRQNHGTVLFQFLVDSDEWCSSLRDNHVWENPHDDCETAAMIHLEMRELESKTQYMDATSLSLFLRAWELNTTMIQALREAKATLDEQQIDSHETAELLEQMSLKFGPESEVGRCISASIAGLEVFIESRRKNSGFGLLLGHEVVDEQNGECGIQGGGVMDMSGNEAPPLYEEQPPVYGDIGEEPIIPPS